MLEKLDSYMQKNEVEPLPHTINLTQIKDLNVSPKTIKLLEENTREKLMTFVLAMI